MIKILVFLKKYNNENTIFKKINLEHFYLFLADILFEIYYKT